jgi:hypothetical protein
MRQIGLKDKVLGIKKRCTEIPPQTLADKNVVAVRRIVHLSG